MMKKLSLILLSLVAAGQTTYGYYSTKTLMRCAATTVIAMLAENISSHSAMPLLLTPLPFADILVKKAYGAFASGHKETEHPLLQAVDRCDLRSINSELAQLLQDAYHNPEKSSNIENVMLHAYKRAIAVDDEQQKSAIKKIFSLPLSLISTNDFEQSYSKKMQIARTVLRLTAVPGLTLTGAIFAACGTSLASRCGLNTDRVIFPVMISSAIIGSCLPFADLVVTPIKNYINKRNQEQSIQPLGRKLSPEEYAELLELNYILAQLLDEVYTDPAKIADAKQFLKESLARASSLEDATKRELSSTVISAAQQILYSIETETSLK